MLCYLRAARRVGQEAFILKELLHDAATLVNGPEDRHPNLGQFVRGHLEVGPF